MGEAEKWREHNVVKAGAGGQEGHYVSAVNASLCSPMYRLHLKKFWVGTKIASQNLTNGKMEYSPQKSDLGHKVLGN